MKALRNIDIALVSLQGRSHWRRKGGHCRPLLPSSSPHFNFPTKQDPTVLVSNTRDVSFSECSEIIQIRNFTIFNMLATIFGQFTVAFHFFQLHRGNRSLHVGPSGKVRYLTLDLLKSLLLWTIHHNEREFKRLIIGGILDQLQKS